MQRRWFVGLAVALLVLTTGAAFPASSATGDETAFQQAQDAPQLSTPDGFDSTEFRITTYENGSARWTITHSTTLDENGSEREQFESFASTFNNNETQTFRDFKTRAEALTAFGTEETNRQMNATAFAKEATVDEQFRVYGRLSMSFTWTNFSRTTANGIVVDDVFAGGMYIGPDQRLVFDTGSDLEFSLADPTPDRFSVEDNLTASDSIEYHGEREFADRRPKVVATSPNATGAAQSATATPSSTGNSTPGDAASSEVGPIPLAIAIVLLLVVGGTIAWYSGNLGGIFREQGGGGNAGATEAETPAGTETTEPSVPEEELLSDEDRVLKLLDENGGRMKQVNIVENTEWSKSKVSMLLSDMEEEGSISKLRVGRENIISKAGEEPDAVGSPFDDE
ncbi:MAG: helix-turn-helix domain-containing protein [Haloarculaceae archaeon]